MVHRIHLGVVGFVVLLSLVVCSQASAQGPTGAIEGVVKDESGGVLPGVTVEVSSPALIEGIRTVVTEADGVYRFLRLPVGTYTVKFGLEGFSTVERTGIVINAGFTATINSDMKVGSVSETITVTGEAPVVDVRSSTTSTVLPAKVIEAIPSARNVFDMSKFVIGASTSGVDVGGSTQHIYSAIQIHGSRANDRGYYRDGVRVAVWFGGGDAPRMYAATGAQQEVNYETAAIPAWVSHGGVVINMVSKDGGDRLSGTVFTSGSIRQMQSTNIDDSLRARGVKLTSGTKDVSDLDTSAGFPIVGSRVWFFGQVRRTHITSLLANQYGLDGNQAENYTRSLDYFLKGSVQFNSQNRLNVSFGHDGSLTPKRRTGATFVTDEAAVYNPPGVPGTPYNKAIVANWLATRGNNWIFEAGFGMLRVSGNSAYQKEVGPDSRARLDIITQTLSGSATRVGGDRTYRQDINVSVSHVFNAGGFHELRFGGQGDWGHFPDNRYGKNDIIYRYRSGVPDSVDLLNSPVNSNTLIREWGVYVQDSWTIARRLTINAGARFDWFKVSIPEQYAAAGTYVGERRFPAIPVVTWQDFVPRLGVSYDLLGTGRTVLKGSYSQYTGVESAGVAQTVNPMYWSTNRCSWTDLNGDNYATLNELSRCQGWTGGLTSTLDPDLRRPFNREYTLGVQHQLARDTGVSVMFFRRENRDNRGTQNLAVPFDSYIPVTIVNPIDDSPLTIYDQSPATAGQQQNIITNSKAFDSTYNGIELALQRRFSPGAYLQVGYHYGRVVGRTTTADINDPNNDIFAKGGIGNDEPHQFKLAGSYLLPWKVSVSGFVSLATGHIRQRTYTVTRSIVPTLTRASQSVRLEPNDVNRYPARNMVDLRLGRPFRFGTRQIEPFVDFYNVFNVSTVLGETTAWGASVGTVSSTISPRIARVGAKVNF